MAEPFKLLINEAVVTALAHHLQRVAGTGAFDAAAFRHRALDGLDTLELKARAGHVASALEAHLPADFDRAAGWLEATLGEVIPPDLQVLPPRDLAQGMGGWGLWPMTEFVARRGLADPERALQALHAMTRRFTAEWAVRPFLLEHPALTLATFERWCRDPSAHVRRLVSEGSRPRLPWGVQLRPLIADPAPTLSLLAALQDDPSAYVRRSVANHLNDIAKDHPEVVVQWLERHLESACDDRRVLLRHASRTLIKQGHARALACWGLGRAFEGRVAFAVSPARIVLGEAVGLELQLQSLARQPQALEVDYVVHHVGAGGRARPKVFKGWKLTLAPGEARTLSRRHVMRPVTTRRYYPGEHRVELQVNGQRCGEAAFELCCGPG
ncbi:3-methyladenine DNA glycosylase AlkC [Sphaerotilus hippei]|uniref:3-methyladenine DNA glycosylase AlkC n=1 Tax=Sphaerotilus hippei TaxID=744406 RepID=A0A318H311_9BURK|nr:DNA alkylation repair protein [Sphaerotilus hippei]PXW97917.1 3-methyladenine DNA glycosylase AlkC [Sphaerotilus hippei]